MDGWIDNQKIIDWWIIYEHINKQLKFLIFFIFKNKKEKKKKQKQTTNNKQQTTTMDATQLFINFLIANGFEKSEFENQVFQVIINRIGDNNSNFLTSRISLKNVLIPTGIEVVEPQITSSTSSSPTPSFFSSPATSSFSPFVSQTSSSDEQPQKNKRKIEKVETPEDETEELITRITTRNWKGDSKRDLENAFSKMISDICEKADLSQFKLKKPYYALNRPERSILQQNAFKICDEGLHKFWKAKNFVSRISKIRIYFFSFFAKRLGISRNNSILESAYKESTNLIHVFIEIGITESLKVFWHYKNRSENMRRKTESINQLEKELDFGDSVKKSLQDLPEVISDDEEEEEDFQEEQEKDADMISACADADEKIFERLVEEKILTEKEVESFKKNSITFETILSLEDEHIMNLSNKELAQFVIKYKSNNK